jgi:hypothetical protein
LLDFELLLDLELLLVFRRESENAGRAADKRRDR